MRDKAIDIRGKHSIDRRSGNHSERRIRKISELIKRNPNCNIEIVKNNSPNNPPRKKGRKDFIKIGGVQYKYHLWAICY